MADYELTDAALASLVGFALENVDGAQLAALSVRSVGEVFSGRRGKPIRVSREGEVLSVELSVVMVYGTPLLERAREIQRAVSDTLIATTGLQVRNVDVAVIDVALKEGDAA